MKRFDIVALGELNVDLILNQIDGSQRWARRSLPSK